MDILMSIVDFIPVGLFLVASIMYQRLLYNKMSKGAFALFSAGTMFVFMAGLFKASYKFLFYCGICDFGPLAQSFFPMQTTGFVLAAIAMIALIFHEQGENKRYGLVLPSLAMLAAPSYYSGTMLFVVLMVLGVLILDASLVHISVELKAKVAIIPIVISFVFTLGMGYLSTKADLSDWIKEFVNTIGQGAFLVSAIVLKKKGLAREDAIKQIKKGD